jgi:hypothetical protein
MFLAIIFAFEICKENALYINTQGDKQSSEKKIKERLYKKKLISE